MRLHNTVNAFFPLNISSCIGSVSCGAPLKFPDVSLTNLSRISLVTGDRSWKFIYFIFSLKLAFGVYFLIIIIFIITIIIMINSMIVILTIVITIIIIITIIITRVIIVVVVDGTSLLCCSVKCKTPRQFGSRSGRLLRYPLLVWLQYNVY